MSPRSRVCLRVMTCLFFLATWSPTVSALSADESPTSTFKVKSTASLVHLGSIDSFEITKGGTEAAKFLLDYINRDNREAARLARQVYDRIIPEENFGGEYTALRWFSILFLLSDQEREQALQDPLVRNFYDFLAANEFAPLKEFLIRKYHLGTYGDEQTLDGKQRERVLEDFVVFQNPVREEWEGTSKILDSLGLGEGDKVADLGCGPGYYTFKFSKLVGDAGHVYAIDIREEHIRYIDELTRAASLENVTPVLAPLDEIEINEKVDFAFCCSLYHIVYSTFSVEQTDAFIDSVKQMLKPDGSFVIVDNALVNDETLPYHGPYIARELVVEQLKFYGFRLVAEHQFIPQRYVLVFKQTDDDLIEPAPTDSKLPDNSIHIGSRVPLVFIPTGASRVSDAGVTAASYFLAALRGDREAAQQASELYERLASIEDLGGDYTAFQWLCQYLLATEDAKKEMLSDWFVAEYYNYLAENDFRPLRTYLRYRYRILDALAEDELLAADALDEDAGVSRRMVGDIRDFILFNNPNRESWERTSRIIELLDLQPGQAVADIGCGPGYYSFKFSQLVGDKGKVFAVDTNDEIVDYVTAMSVRHNVRNVETIVSKLDDSNLPSNSADVVFLCSLYHVIYSNSLESVKDRFIDSIKKALRPGGRVVIIDNNVADESTIRYTGAAIDRRLIIAQLKHYGFRLVRNEETIPQRYFLEFVLE